MKRSREARVVTPALAFGFVAIFFVLAVGLVVELANLGTAYRAAGAVAHTNDVRTQLRALQFRKPLDYEKFLAAVRQYVKPAGA